MITVESGIISLGSNMKYLQKRMDVISNNISNSDTTGYKRDKTIGRSFNSILSSEMQENYPTAEDRWNSGVVDFKPGVYVEETVTDYTQGRIEKTGESCDIAIKGGGFMVLENADGKLYARSISAKLNDDNYLSFLEKGNIIGENGPIRITDSNYNIGKDGTVYVNGQVLDKIKIVGFNNKKALAKVGDGLYKNLKGDENIIDVTDSEVIQGSLEASNVNMTEEMVGIIEVLRRYQSSQKAMQMFDQIYGLAVNEIGKI